MGVIQYTRETPLAGIIKAQIRAHGPMNLADYMSLCLCHPEHGYYMTRDPFGLAGDFTTAPEMSQLFGEMIGVWIADCWMKLGSPSEFALIECGAGRGTLMADALRATRALEGFHAAMKLHILEISPVLRAAQEKALSGSGATWHSDIESIRVNSPVIIIGNEFLDALPVRQLVYRDTGWMEKKIDLDKNDTLRLCEFEVGDGVKPLIPSLLLPPKQGDQIEVSLEQKEALHKVMNIIQKQGGSALFIDYGFMHNIAGDTLQAVKNHQYCGLLDSPGECDITAHVNFAEITALALEQNMTVHGPVPQGEFLDRLGIGVRAEILTQNATDAQRTDMATALMRLRGQNTEAGEMGKLFKAIAITADPNLDLAGFS